MLRITEKTDDESTVLLVEGKLVPPWVQELESCCSRAVSLRPCTLVLDLRSVTFVSSEGKNLLRGVLHAGAKLITSGTVMNGIVEELKKQTEQEDFHA